MVFLDHNRIEIGGIITSQLQSVTEHFCDNNEIEEVTWFHHFDTSKIRIAWLLGDSMCKQY